jgi:hypothetical protein
LVRSLMRLVGGGTSWWQHTQEQSSHILNQHRESTCSKSRAYNDSWHQFCNYLPWACSQWPTGFPPDQTSYKLLHILTASLFNTQKHWTPNHSNPTSYDF